MGVAGFAGERFVAPHFRLPKGYYSLVQIFLLLAFMALSRIKTVEQLRYAAPGELGKLLGLDRIPEVRTLRKENFFKYMIQHFEMDRLMEYQTEPADETKKVVNPAHRKLESGIKTKAATRARRLAAFGQVHLTEDLSDKQIAAYEGKKTALREQIEGLDRDLEQLKTKRRETPRHIALGQLPEDERFAQLAPVRKQFLDTIRMIAYRAETAMAVALRDVLARADDARPLVREIFSTEADLIPDYENNTLTVRLHHLTNAISDAAARALAATLNESETCYPGTNLRLIYKLVSDEIP